MKVKKGDNVIILTGKDRGKTGKIDKVLRSADKVIISGLNVSKFHQKARKGGEKGQTVEKSMPIHASNVKLVSEKGSKIAPKTEKGTKSEKTKKTSKTEKAAE